MLDLDEDVVTGVYPRKTIDWTKVKRRAQENPNISEDELHAASLEYNLNVKDPKKVLSKKGFIEVLDGATGFMLIKRECLLKMKEAYPDLKYKTDQIINNKEFDSENTYLFFDTMKDDDGRYLSEDYAFSRRWQKIGGKIYADIGSKITHFGSYRYSGELWKHFNFPKS
jgi:hypothetical protein